jgi:hypothetical protein
MKLEKRVAELETEVKLLKELVMALVSKPAYPERTGPAYAPTVKAADLCGCPKMTGAHYRGSGCLDSWVTCGDFPL